MRRLVTVWCVLLPTLALVSCSPEPRSIVEELLAASVVDKKVLSPSRQSPLEHAVSWKKIEEAERLIKAGADVNDVDYLSIAAAGGNREMVQLLMAAGAKVNPESGDDNFPLWHAALVPHPGIVADLLAAGADVHRLDFNGETALFAAISEKSYEVVVQLIKAGSDVNWRGFMNRTPLWYAAGSGQLDIAQALIEAGADVDAVADDGSSVLQEAITGARSEEMVRLLLKHGAKRNFSESHIYGALHPDCAFETPGENLLRALKAAGYTKL